MRRLFLYDCDPEIETTFRLRRKKQKVKEQRCEARRTSTNKEGGEGDQRWTPRDFVTPRVHGIGSSIARPNVDAKNFELKPTLISMVQQSLFGGTPETLKDGGRLLLMI